MTKYLFPLAFVSSWPLSRTAISVSSVFCMSWHLPRHWFRKLNRACRCIKSSAITFTPRARQSKLISPSPVRTGVSPAGFHRVHLFPSPRWCSLAMTSSQVWIWQSGAGAHGNSCPSCHSDPIRDLRQLSIIPLFFIFIFLFFLPLWDLIMPPDHQVKGHTFWNLSTHTLGCFRTQFRQQPADRSDAISPVKTHIWEAWLLEA